MMDKGILYDLGIGDVGMLIDLFNESLILGKDAPVTSNTSQAMNLPVASTQLQTLLQEGFSPRLRPRSWDVDKNTGKPLGRYFALEVDEGGRTHKLYTSLDVADFVRERAVKDLAYEAKRENPILGTLYQFRVPNGSVSRYITAPDGSHWFSKQDLTRCGGVVLDTVTGKRYRLGETVFRPFVDNAKSS